MQLQIHFFLQYYSMGLRSSSRLMVVHHQSFNDLFIESSLGSSLLINPKIENYKQKKNKKYWGWSATRLGHPRTKFFF
jgi:phosphate starvation-inducible membrane PsiE